jgi:opacity protein-like surface antigen
MTRRIVNLFLSLLVVTSVAVAAEKPEPEELVDSVIGAAGGEGFAGLGVLQLEVSQEEFLDDGTSKSSGYTLYLDTGNLANRRLEYPNGVVLGSSRTGNWASTNGVMDDRPQTPRMVRTTLNQTIFPLLMPFSLKMDGVWAREVRESVVDEKEVWVLWLPFAKGFFKSPVLETTWSVVVDREDSSFLSAEFVPPVEYRKISSKGIRYRVLTYEEINGVRIPTQVLAIGIDVGHEEGGHHRLTKIKPTVRAWEPGLFLSPAQLEALEED